jgi:hypothetical protein
MESEKKLAVNCGLACLLRDQEGVLDTYDKVTINCGTFIASREVYAKLAAKHAQLNTGDVQIKEVTGTILQLDANTVIDENVNLKGLFVLVSGSLIVKGGGLAKLGEAEGIIVLDNLYYPVSGDLASLARVSGQKRPYPDGAHVLLGDQTLAKALAAIPPGLTHLWIDGTLSALDAKALESAKAAGIRIDCGSLFTYEGLYAAYGGLFRCPEPVLVGDGYEITGNIEAVKLPLYGPKVYVNGDFSMEAKDLPLLEALEAIVVRGRATLPVSAVRTFKTKGRAGDYEILDGRLVTINGNVQWGHRQFAGAPEEKLIVTVNGCLRFDDDVTEEDLDCIAALSCNGAVLLPSRLKGVLAPRIKNANGFIGDEAEFEKMTGRNIKDYAAKAMDDAMGDNVTRINTGSYILI